MSSLDKSSRPTPLQDNNMIDAIDRACAGLADKVGFAVGPLKLLVCLLLSYPLAGILKRLPHQRTVVNVYVVACSLFFLVGILDLTRGLVELVGAALVTYGLSTVRHPAMPWLNFVVVMAHMSVNQIKRQRIGDESAIDVTGAQMVLVMKLTAFAWNVHDGRVDKTRKNALPTLPNLLDYLAWVLFFPALLIGPSFDYALYEDWLTLRLYGPGARRIPRSGRAGTKRALEGLFWLGLFAYLSPRYTTDAVLDYSFEKRSLISRLFYIVPLAFAARTKYYGVWKVSEGACILCGFGYERTGDRVRWNGIENISPYEFETSPNTKALLESWNKNTNRWLKEYVYLRVTPAGRKPGFFATLATFGTSAIWHGFYPGYYFAFVTGAFAQTVGKLYRRNLRPHFVDTPYKRAYDVVGWAVTQMTWNYISQPFIVLSFWPSLLFFRRYYYYVHVGMLLSFLFFNSPLAKTIRPKRTERREQSVTVIPDAHMDAEGMTEAKKDIDRIAAQVKQEVDRLKSA